ncbi:Glu/Leu/Phe/Val dehydrogenase dimerization domain-containing protein [Persicobacter psychrovividus]|uniref:Amino acid dehydrogenase n=1 Tax=Persicobacter psychrovividus TaxID=387638 RepID=A0ABM7VEB2_9BACT|nr:amino acid dehydrogenase [Persicobacter psychrovividus]
MKTLLNQFEEKPAEIIFEWNDPHTEAKGWVVINSLRGGAAGGGTRMRKGLDVREVLSLAKTMEIKFTVSGPNIGGAKSGIDFDPKDPRKTEVLKRWYKAVTPLLKAYYGTGGDLNIDEIDEVIPITEDFGLWHPQEGIVNGHHQATAPQKIKKLGQLRLGVKKVIEDLNYTPDVQQKLTISDMVTGFGVAEAVYHYYQLWGGNLKGKRAIIQGWGNVGAAAGFFLTKHGARVVGIIDKNGGLLTDEGFSQEEINTLFSERNGNQLKAENLLSFEQANQQIWTMGAEIFIPAAASRLVQQQQVQAMIDHGLEVISCGANVPFNDPEIFMGKTTKFADEKVAILSDFIANCGMARVFAYLMSTEVEITDTNIFTDISATIKKALHELHQRQPQKHHLAERSLEIALKKLL